MARKKDEGMLVLHDSRCPSEFKTRSSQLSRSRCFDALNSLEKYRNRVLCSECVGILRPGETKTLWPEKWFENVGWHMYDVSGACDSSLKCCIASTIAETWKHVKQTFPQFLDGISDAKASFHMHVMFWVHEIRSLSDGLQAGSASI